MIKNKTKEGRGLFGSDHKIIDHNPKTVWPSTSELGDFYLLCTGQILDEFWQNRLTRRVATVAL